MAMLSKADEQALAKAEAARIAANQAALAKAVESAAAQAAVRSSEAAVASLKVASSEYQEAVAKEVAKALGQAKREVARQAKRGGYSLLGHRAGSQGFQMDEAACAFIRAHGKWPSAAELVAFAPELVEYDLSRVKGHLAHVRAKHADDIRKHFPGI